VREKVFYFVRQVFQFSLWKYPGELNWYLNFSLSALKNIQKELTVISVSHSWVTAHNKLEHKTSAQTLPLNKIYQGK